MIDRPAQIEITEEMIDAGVSYLLGVSEAAEWLPPRWSSSKAFVGGLLRASLSVAEHTACTYGLNTNRFVFSKNLYRETQNCLLCVDESQAPKQVDSAPPEIEPTSTLGKKR